ncbi:MAG: UDP-N-acetylmuramoyl-L-alanine--D-glutamate ligase [Candidatus Brocadiia bacterium]
MGGEAHDQPVELCARKTLMDSLRSLRGVPVTVMGLGLFGGGEGAVRYLARAGARVTVTDLKSADQLAEPIGRLSDLPVEYVLGEHREADFTSASLVVANPAVPRSNMYLRAAADRGVPVTSPMNIFLALCPVPVVAVTGSNGKSTTTALVADMLRSGGRKVRLGGNIGVSLLPSLEDLGEEEVAVLEMSSFQLADAGAMEWSPRGAVVTNITPNHLKWHGGFKEYSEAKRNIVRFQSASDFAVLNADDPVLRGWASEPPSGRVMWFHPEADASDIREGMSLSGDHIVLCEGGRRELICRRSELKLPGPHNGANAIAAAAAAHSMGVGAKDIRRALAGFDGLAHRLELVGQFEGVRFYNDSFSTTPESVVAALRSFETSIVLIAGGYDKGLDLSPVARAAARHAQVVVTMGQTGPSLARLTRREGACAGKSLPVREADSLEEAVRTSAEVSMPGTAVVFSPGCASYDMFDNYRQRGEMFKELVRASFGGRRCSKGA